ncbi:head-tail connector protein [Bacillus sp. FSL W7-1034]|uniref:head-tail connector protein n=1 Tax=Bacillus TaxID=1386 RepID=UPI001B3A184C|nr:MULTISPECIES: head-tail connector protein [Bacillus]MBQ4816425.1 phage gp6-like head-tail connector protein [Bacillus pumilus]MCY7690891.1 head-tail connector protein [Bacillus altitudinis]MEC3812993.1 head-tail connector protein [Bacillus altitudinis]MED1424958.1 head-tail connector protein [Bacillus altitudinis]MED1480178.1 head-tail connector protein [Bacillus altitudinis]
MTLEELKHALRITHDLDDKMLETIKAAAEKFIKDSVTLSKERDAFFNDNPCFDDAVMMLCGHRYENRSAVSNKNLQEVPFGVMSYIQQFKGEYPSWTTDD